MVRTPQRFFRSRVILGTMRGLLICAIVTALCGCKESPEEAAARLTNLWQFGTAEAIRQAVREGTDVKSRDADGRTPLHIAARVNSHAEVITALVAAGADVNATDPRGSTPLMYMLEEPLFSVEKSTAVVESLLQAGAKVKIKIPPGTQDGAVFRIRGKGAPKLKGSDAGDLKVKARIAVPKHLSDAQREALEAFSAGQDEDVRAHIH